MRLPARLRGSIGAQIAAATVIVSTLVLALGGAALLWSLRDAGEQALQAKATLAADRLALALVAPIWNTDQDGARTTVDAELADRDLSAVLAHEGEGEGKLFLGRSSGGADATTMPTIDGVMLERPILREDKVIGRVAVLVNRTSLEVQQRTLTVAVIAGIAVIEVVLIIAIVAALRRLVVVPLAGTVRVLEAMANGHTDERLDDGRADEIGRLAGAVNRTVNRMRRVLEVATSKAEAVATASDGLVGVGGQLRKTADAGRAQAQSLADSAKALSSHLAAVTAATTEMESSIREITRTAGEAVAAGGEAAQAVAEAESLMTQLGQASERISSVIQTIQRIASQTNLLALNATIEAARAGEAGRGFVVVANEVKGLSRQTAEATSGIISQVSDVRSAVAAIAGQLAAILAATRRVTEMQHTVSAAVEEQSATTAEMSRNGARVGEDMQAMSDAAQAVAAATAETLQAAGATEQAAQDFKRQSAELLEATRGSSPT
jgi:methyl-accepting chemotaxis protein